MMKVLIERLLPRIVHLFLESTGTGKGDRDHRLGGIPLVTGDLVPTGKVAGMGINVVSTSIEPRTVFFVS
jgi:hypothetical protein